MRKEVTPQLWRALGGNDFFTLHILHLLMSKIQHPTSTDRSSTEKTTTLGPLAQKKHQNAIPETLFQASFVHTSAQNMWEGMHALANVLNHLGSDAGPLVWDVVTHIRTFFNHEYRTTLSLCCPYLGLRRVQAALTFHVQGSEQVRQEQLLRDLCRHLLSHRKSCAPRGSLPGSQEALHDGQRSGQQPSNLRLCELWKRTHLRRSKMWPLGSQRPFLKALGAGHCKRRKNMGVPCPISLHYFVLGA